VYPKNINIS
jgi:katanin p80 WD40 repeat-containing subunit B1